MSSVEQADIVRLLDHAGARLAGVRDEAMLVEAMDDVMARLVDCEYVGLFFLVRETGRLRHAFARGFTEEERREAERTAMDRHIGKVFRERVLLHLPDVRPEEDPSAKVNPRRHVVRSRLTLPVLGRGESVGVISLGSTRPFSFTPIQISVLTFVASLAGVVYWNLADLADLKAQYAVTEAQKAELLVLSAPILEVAPGVLLLPLVGRLDAERAGQIAARLLAAISTRSTRAALFDVTGMEAAETASIGALLGIMRAAALMGVACVISGMTPRLAKQLVSLELALPEVRFFSTASAALAALLGR